MKKKEGYCKQSFRKVRQIFFAPTVLALHCCVAGAATAVSDPTTQPELVKYCDLYKNGVEVADKTPLVNGGCRIDLNAILLPGETAKFKAKFSSDTIESEKFSNEITLSRPKAPPVPQWSGIALDTKLGQMYSATFSQAGVTHCAYSVNGSPFVEIAALTRSTTLNYCKIPITGGGKQLLEYKYIVNDPLWPRMDGQTARFSYALPVCN